MDDLLNNPGTQGYAGQIQEPSELALLKQMGALGEGPGLQYLYVAP